MNIALVMSPKPLVAYLYNDFTVRQALEKMSYHGYSAIPVIDRDGKYIGTVSEGSFLWYLVKGTNGELSSSIVGIEELEQINLSEIPFDSRNTPVRVSASVEELYDRMLGQNFVPVVDDRDIFVGIVTRKAILSNMAERLKKYEDMEQDEDS